MSNIPHFDVTRGPRIAAALMVGLLTVLVIAAVIWMNYASLNISVRAMGKVVPTSRIQFIQSLEGGIIRDITVREGMQVKKGDLLAYIENLQYDSDLGEGLQNKWAAEAGIERLRSQIENRNPQFSEVLRSKAPDVVAEQLNLAASSRRELQVSLDTLNSQLSQRKQELSESKSRVVSAQNLLASARETLAIEENLRKQSAGAQVDYLNAQREVTRLEGEIEAGKITINRVQAAVREAESRMAGVTSKYRADAYRELNDLQARLAALNEQLTGQEDRVSRRELRSPMDGVVNRVLVSTIGGVAKPGETIMEIVPLEDNLRVSVRVKPSDIAFISIGQKAIVRITAYDSSIFGSLDGKVVRVGADAVVEQQGQNQESYFEVTLETERNYIGKPEERLTISSGMAADASIETGKRTLMEYVLKPVIKTLDTSLRER